MCDYAEAYILVDGTIRATNAVNATRLALKNCADLTIDNSDIFKYKIKLLGNVTEVAGNAAAVRRLNVKIVVPLKYLSNFFRSLEMPLINCKIKLNLTWKKECVLSTGAGETVFIINDTKLYVPVVTLSKEDNKDFIK